MTLYAQAIGGLKRDLLDDLNRHERELATPELAYAAASDAEASRLETLMADTIAAIDDIAAELDALDEAGFWRDR